MKQVKGYTKKDYIEGFDGNAIEFDNIEEAANFNQKLAPHFTKDEIIERIYSSVNCDDIVMNDGSVISYSLKKDHRK